MTAEDLAQWMLAQLEREGCMYQDDVVDRAVKENAEGLLRENVDGNLVVGTAVLNAFKKLTETRVVWVRSDFYWRLRVAEDEPGREARG